MLTELPEFKCHKIVRAGKIVGINADFTPLREGEPNSPNGWVFLSLEGVLEKHKVDAEWIARHKPQIGNYFVVYEGGYQSVSPAKAFEAGYTKL